MSFVEANFPIPVTRPNATRSWSPMWHFVKTSKASALGREADTASAPPIGSWLPEMTDSDAFGVSTVADRDGPLAEVGVAWPPADEQAPTNIATARAEPARRNEPVVLMAPGHPMT